jgi:hypothetical protein
MNANVKLPIESSIERRQCADELVQLIRKLRWIGMDDEARRMQALLCCVRPEESGSVLTECGSTD